MSLFFLFFWKFIYFYWRIIALHNFAIFCQTSTWISHRYTYIPLLLKCPPITFPIPPLLVDTEPLIEFLEPYRKFPLAIYFKYGNVGEGDGIPLQHSCLENPMDGEAWWAAVYGLLGVGHNWVTSFSLLTFMHWRRQWQPTPVFLPGESQGQGAWWATVYGVTQSRRRLKWLSSSRR